MSSSRVRVRLFFLLLSLYLLFGPLSGSATPPLPPLRRAPSVAAATAPSRPRLLVCIASHFAPGRTTAHLERVVAEYVGAYGARFDVRVHVDTNSDALAPLLARAHPSARVDVRVWTLAELGDALHLPYVHRHLMQTVADDFDFFVFSEDDVLVPLAAFSRYVAQRVALQARGWAYGWVRAEVWAADNATAIAIDNVDPVVDARVYDAGGGALFAEPWSPYAAVYALDADELRAMIADTSGVWTGGFPPFLPREKMSIGWAFKYTGGAREPYGAKGWRARALVPLTPDGRVHPEAIVWHLPRKYAVSKTLGFHDLGSVKVDDVFQWTRGVGDAVALPFLPP
jgi:hypothetical protein